MRMNNQWLLLVLFLGTITISVKPQVDSAGAFRELNQKLLNCEQNLFLQDFVVNHAVESFKGKDILIVVVRNGIREKSNSLLERRIFNVRKYFIERGSRLGSDQVLVTEGAPVDGHGRVEYYLGGRLFQQVLFPTNGYVCHSCCGPDTGYFPDKLSSKKRPKKVTSE